MRRSVQRRDLLAQQRAHWELAGQRATIRTREARLAVETGRTIRDYRLDQGWTLRETARRLGVSAPYLSDVERGRRSPARVLLGLIDGKQGGADV